MSWSGSNSDQPPPPPPAPSSIEPDGPSDGDDDDIIMPNPNNWFFDKERLENTPSRKLGIDADRELMYRQQSANFIQDMGQRLQVNQLCINTAIVYMHRFYMYHSFSMFARNNVSTASIFLAAKVEEQPRKLEYVIKVAHYCLHRESIPSIDIKSEAYTTQCTDLVNTENILLQTLGFDVGIDHPHTHVVKCCQLVRASKDLAQTSYFMATNSLHLTTMCMQYKPSVVACVCIHLACKWSNWEIPRSKEGRDWYWYVDDTVTAEQLEALTTEFLTIFNKSPSRLKKKIISLSAATSGSGGMNMSNFPSHFNFDAFNKQSSNSGGAAPGSSKPRMLPPYSKSGQPPLQPPPPTSAGGIPPLLGRPMRPPSLPPRDPVPLLPTHMAGPLKIPTIHGQPPQSSSANKHSMQHGSTARPIPVHHSGSSHPSSGGVPRDGVPRDGVPRDSVPRDGVPRDGVPRDGVPRDGVPRDGVPRDGVPRDGSHVSRLPHAPPPPSISSHHQQSHQQPYPPHHGARPAPHALPVSSASGGISGSSSHVTNSQSVHGQSHAPAGQKPQSQSGQMGHPMSSQQRQPPTSGQPLKPLLPPGSLSMKQPHGSAPMSGNKIPGQPPQQHAGQPQQPPVGAPHSGQLKRPYSELTRPENRMEINSSNSVKRECLPGDVRRANAPPMPQAPPAPTKAQLQSLATQARAREKSEKMNVVQMAMLKKPHDSLTWAGSNKQQQPVPELPPHTLLQRPESSHYMPQPPPPPTLSANSSHSGFKIDYHQNLHGAPPASQPAVVPKHEFPPAVSHSVTSNHGNNSVSGSNIYSSNSSIPKNDFAYPFLPLSPINTKNEYVNPPPVPTNNLANAINVKPEFVHNSKESRKNHNELSSHVINIKSEQTGPPQLLPAPPVAILGSMNNQRNDFTISLPLKNIPKKEPQQQQTAPPMSEVFMSMPKLEPAPLLNTLNLGTTILDNNNFSNVDSGFVGMTDVDSHEAGSEQSSGSKKKKKKKEHKHKDRHREKEEKKHKDKGDKKHRDEEKKKHREKEEKRPEKEEKEKKHKEKDEGRKHKKDKHKDKSSREKHGKSGKEKHGSVIGTQDDLTASSKIKIVFGRSGGENNSNDTGSKSSKKQHPTASVVYY